MKRCFADTFYFLALLIEDDESHGQAIAFSESFDGRLVTTEWVLTELGDALAGERHRKKFLDFLAFLRTSPRIKIVRSSGHLFDEGVDLYASRRDKDWSLTDCISFVVMRRLKLSEAVTGDHHFVQAGFIKLMK